MGAAFCVYSRLQNILADINRLGIIITIIDHLLMLLFAATYWKWIGVL